MADTLIQGTTIIEDKRASGTSGLIWSTPGTSFVSQDPASDSIIYDTTDGSTSAQEDNKEFVCPVELPNGATVTKVTVHGNAAAAAGITWTLSRVTFAGVVGAMASAAVNTEDTTITNPIIDNNTFSYFISSGANEWDTNDKIFGATITYTT